MIGKNCIIFAVNKKNSKPMQRFGCFFHLYNKNGPL